jgi:hypothetical protein
MGRGVRLSLREVFEAVELPQMEEDPEASKLGRPPYPFKSMLNGLIMIPFGIASESELARKLKAIPSLAEECGFEPGETPSQPTINRFKHKLGLKCFRKVFRRLVGKLMGNGVIEGISIVVDATKLEALRGDPDARWGYAAKNEPFFGYKVHIAADFKSETPLEVRVTPANQHENRMFKPLVKKAKHLDLKASRICGDAIHDNKATRRFIRSLKAKAFIDQNPRRRGAGEKKKPSKTYRRLKASVERVFSRAKELLNLEKLNVRGLRSVSIWVHLVLTAMLAVATAAAGKGLESQIRCIRSIFG